MTGFDLSVLVAYILVTLLIGAILGRSRSAETYLANDRGTSFSLLLFSNVATWIGAGAVVGVCSQAYSTGVSYGLSVMAVNAGFALFFAYLAPRIKKLGDSQRAYTLGDLFARAYGERCRGLFGVCYLGIAVIWGAVQLLAIAQLLSLLFGLSLLSALSIALLFTLIYSVSGGLRSDIYTDAVQFWVMLITFLIIIPTEISVDGGLESVRSLPSGHFDPLAFGGLPFFLGSIFLGLLYPLSSAVEYQRVFSANSEATARRAYLWSAPLMLFFIGCAVSIGLLAASHHSGLEGDQVFFVMMQKTLPSGLLGLGYASVLALVMSSLDSLLVAGSAALARDVLPVITGTSSERWMRMPVLRALCTVFGICCVVVAWCLPSIVHLSLIAAYVSLCFAPAVLAMLLQWPLSPNRAFTSMVLSLGSLIVGWPFLEKNVFIVLVVLGFLPVLLRTKKSA